MVSVIIPVYNTEKYLKRCLDSVLNQSYTDIEVIVVNDGSTDNSLQILKEYEKNDNRIKLIDQQNQGVSSARNVGLDNVQGEFILYVDSDDWLELDAIQRLLATVTDDTDIVFCSSDNAEQIDSVKREKEIKYEYWDNDRQILEFLKHKRMTGMLWNKLIRRSLTFDIFFNEKTCYGEDAEFLWQVLKKSKKMIVTNEILYHHVLEETSISHLSFSDKKFSAIPMWESICKDVDRNYFNYITFARVSLTSAAVYSLYEAKSCKYENKLQIGYMRSIVRKNINVFLKAKNVSKKFKLYAIAVCLGY